MPRTLRILTRCILNRGASEGMTSGGKNEALHLETSKLHLELSAALKARVLAVTSSKNLTIRANCRDTSHRRRFVATPLTMSHFPRRMIVPKEMLRERCLPLEILTWWSNPTSLYSRQVYWCMICYSPSCLSNHHSQCATSHSTSHSAPLCLKRDKMYKLLWFIKVRRCFSSL